MSTQKNKLMYQTPYLSLYQTPQGFYYCQRQTINSVAGLCYKLVANKPFFLLRYQPLPETFTKKNWKQLYPCPITGAIDPPHNPTTAMIQEVYEEGGIIISVQNIEQSSQFVATTQMNEIVFLFLINVTNLNQTTPLGDGSIFEKVSKNKWVNLAQLQQILQTQLCLSSLWACYQLFLRKQVG